ncbi:MAG: NAD(P)H-hydrate dehydratase [Ruminococcaceae bacterium]|nr:NAD(P)H-hydrate dehydratase [Oscillospiraceae bacterium]
MDIREHNPSPLYKSVDLNDLRFCFKDREDRCNKGDFGNILCICGSFPDENELGLAMSGAAVLCGKAAFRTGAGLVRIYTHRENYAPMSKNLPEAVMLLYGEKTDTELLTKEIKRSTAIVIGCGIGKSQRSIKILETTLREASCPLIIDADGLNILSDNPHLWELLSAEQKKQTVITPHMKEFSRLCGESVENLLSSPAKYAADFSKRMGIITLLKDHKTVITDGNTVYVNQSGNAGMATAGSGDALAGIICGMLGNGALEARSLLHKVAIAAYLHGLAGDFAAELYGEHCMIASDIVECICDAVALCLR